MPQGTIRQSTGPRQIDGKPVHRHPTPDADADRTDLGLGPVAAIRPDADAARRTPAFDAEITERVDNPAFDRMDETAHVIAPACASRA
jgi:hypothetical protein